MTSPTRVDWGPVVSKEAHSAEQVNLHEPPLSGGGLLALAEGHRK